MKIALGIVVGAAALLVGSAGGRAAELHGGAPLLHARACSQYGPGFRPMPGTGACVKVGGWAQSDVGSGGAGRINWGALNDRAANDVAMPVRGDITTDVRKQTGYGTVRAYMSVGVAR